MGFTSSELSLWTCWKGSYQACKPLQKAHTSFGSCLPGVGWPGYATHPNRARTLGGCTCNRNGCAAGSVPQHAAMTCCI
jgi:hypothetical protein